MDDDAEYFGNPSLMPETDDEEFGDIPGADNGMPFVYYVRTRYGGSGVTIRACVVVKDEEKHTFKLSAGKPTFNKISEELLPKSVIVIDCPEFNGQKSIHCETLGGYTISEMQEFINNGGIVKIKRSNDWSNISPVDTYYYEANSFIPVTNHDQTGIVFYAVTAAPSWTTVTNEYSETGESEVYCGKTFVSDENHKVLVWAYNELIDGYKSNSDTSVEIDSWLSVQQIVQSGRASEVFKIGDQLICQKSGKVLVWDIIGIDHDIPVDKTKTHSLTLQLHDCFDGMKFNFDASEPTNPNADRAKIGSNNWVESNIRQWLNSNKSANNWFEPQTEYDTAPRYANIDGFLYGMDADFVSVLGEVSKTTMLNEVTDGGSVVDSTEKIFLLSMTEVYCGGDEGTSYEYYTSASSVGQPNSAADDARIKYSNGVAVGWWTRTANVYTSGKMRPVSTDGSISWTDAYLETHGVAPACCII